MTVLLDLARDHPLLADVMVVDDQPTSRIILEKVLKGIGSSIRVSSFGSPVSALLAAETNPPDLIVADYKMPELDGVEFTRRIRALPACHDVPIVVVTVIDDKAVMYEALEAGATDFLTKPVDHYECKVRCRNLLTMRRQQLIIRNRAASVEYQIRQSADDIRIRERETLARLARAGAFKDYVSASQLARIGRLSRAIAAELGLNARLCETIELAAPLHDIGKIGVPDRILQKPGPLTPEERETMKSHTRNGFEILRDSTSAYLSLGASIALSHHESYDGSGYPAGAAGDEIPMEARIVAVADILDALLSDRPYKKAWPMPEALSEISKLRGNRLDPRCVDALYSCLDQFMQEWRAADIAGSLAGWGGA
ncbi:MAG: response regulator [Gammaproteobacteria bacterium]|nr:response regulator [Gammaproteobacteria bacterium]